MRFPRLAFAALLVIGASTLPSSAQLAPDPARVAAAKDLITAMGADAQFDTVVDALLNGLKNSLKQQRPAAAAEIDDVMKRLAEKFKARKSEVSEMSAPIYAEHFTLEELKELAAFYSTPIGRKLVTQLPLISRKSIDVGMKWGQRIGREAAEEARQELRKRGIEL